MEGISIQHEVFLFLFSRLFGGNRDTYLPWCQLSDLANGYTGISEARFYNLSEVLIHEVTRGYDTGVYAVPWCNSIAVFLFTLVIDCELQLDLRTLGSLTLDKGFQKLPRGEVQFL